MAKKIKTLGKVERTGRGFEIVHFTDRSGVPCSLQASSLAEYDKPGTSAVWLGCDDADPKVFRPHAPEPWQKVKMPDGYIANTRAHLGREQVEALIRHLQSWLETDSFDG